MRLRTRHRHHLRGPGLYAEPQRRPSSLRCTKDMLETGVLQSGVVKHMRAAP